MKEKSSLMLKSYNQINFGKRCFYIPSNTPATISIQNDNLYIDMADFKKYVLVDGVKCYYCVTYNAKTDKVDTWINNFKMDEQMAELVEPYFVSFSFAEKSFPWGRDKIIYEPTRDYSELTQAFLKEHPEMDEKIVKFLTKHPKYFGQDFSVEEPEYVNTWISFNKLLSHKEYPIEELLSDFGLSEQGKKDFLEMFSK